MNISTVAPVAENPYKLGVGTWPPFLVGRDEQLRLSGVSWTVRTPAGVLACPTRRHFAMRSTSLRRALQASSIRRPAAHSIRTQTRKNGTRSPACS